LWVNLFCGLILWDGLPARPLARTRARAGKDAHPTRCRKFSLSVNHNVLGIKVKIRIPATAKSFMDL
jgi:hypothetical protein